MFLFLLDCLDCEVAAFLPVNLTAEQGREEEGEGGRGGREGGEGGKEEEEEGRKGREGRYMYVYSPSKRCPPNHSLFLSLTRGVLIIHSSSPSQEVS